MPVFYFRAKNLSGAEIEGRREAADRYELASNLKKEGYFLIGQKEETKKESVLKFVSILRRVSIQEKMMFARNLGVMAGAGVSLIRGLDVLSRQTGNSVWRDTLQKLAQAIKKGQTLSQSMEDYPKFFSPLFRSMVKAGEVSGKLEEALRLIAQQLERDYDLRRKVRGAFAYPLIILAAMLIIGILMMVYVVPTLIDTFKELGVELPATTKLVVGVSSFIINHWILTLLAALSVFSAAVMLASSQKGKEFFSAVFLKTPVISGLMKKINSARVSRTLSSLVSSGIEIVEALQITEGVVRSPKFKRVLNLAREEIQKGNPVSRAFIENRDVFPLLVGEMMSVGEETGKFSEMLFKLASFYEEDVSESTKSLSTIIEPALMMAIGIFVGFFAISMIQPLYSISSGF